MTRLTYSFLSLCIALGTTSCASNPPATIEVKDLLVEYRVEGEFGSIYHHVPSLQIGTDGMAIKRSPSQGTMTIVQLDAATLDDLKRKLGDAQFPTLQRVYGCPGCADGPAYAIDAAIDDQRYEVGIDGEGRDYPDTLQTLFLTLQALAQP